MTEANTSLLYLWNLRTLYIGEVLELDESNQGAASIVFGIEGDVEITKPAKDFSIRCRSILLPAGTSFTMESFGKNIGVFYLDPVGEDFAMFKSLMQPGDHGVFLNCKYEQEQIQALNQVHKTQMAETEAYDLLGKVFFQVPERETLKHKVDDRIRAVIDIIKNELTVNHPNQELAERVGLTEVQLSRLFKATTGVPIRRYRLWHRLFVTASLMAQGNTITDAALEAGFSDSSHFNHVFRSMLGMKPSTVLNRKDNMKIFVGGLLDQTKS